jgi:hypothetical protein
MADDAERELNAELWLEGVAEAMRSPWEEDEEE